MKKHLQSFILFFLVALLLPTLTLGQEDILLQKVIRALEAPFRADAPQGKAVRDFQAEFRQQSHLASLDRSQHGRGKVAVQFVRTSADRPPSARFRWDYQEPTPQEIVSDGRTLWVYVPENRQVIQSEIDAAVQDRPDDPMSFLTGLGNLSRDFHIAWGSPARDAEGNFILDLAPRRPSAVLQRMQVVVDKQAASAREGQDFFPLRSVVVIDPVGNSTEIAFRNVRVNRGLPDRHFQFKPPAGVEVVRPTGRMQ